MWKVLFVGGTTVREHRSDPFPRLTLEVEAAERTLRRLYFSA